MNNICDVFIVETQIASASYARKMCNLFDDMNGENEDFIQDCYYFGKALKKAVICGERMIEFHWYNRLTNRMVDHLISLGYIVEKYHVDLGVSIPQRLSDDFPNDEVNYWIVSW